MRRSEEKSMFFHWFKTYLTVLFLLIPSAVWAHGISDADKGSIIAGGHLEYLRLGAMHMLTGYDHLLFIFGIIFFLTGFRDVLKYITAFTLGHSMTLVLGTLFGISANYYLIDAVIALSVCYKGFENIDGFNRYLGRRAPNLVAVVFAFGLLHGFGLATRLQQLPLGEEGLIWRILSFNVGVEVGQVAALAIMLLLIAGWRRSLTFSRFALVANRGLIVAGLALFAFQVHGFGHSIGLDLPGFEGTAANIAEAGSDAVSESLEKALQRYDRAFVERDTTALWELFAEDVILYEQGSANVGRDDALGGHLGPDLQAFLQMQASFSATRIREIGATAIRTRDFSVKARLPERLLLVKGLETQNWIYRDGAWRLVHMHWSFSRS